MQWFFKEYKPVKGWERRFAWYPVTNGRMGYWLDWYWVRSVDGHVVFDNSKTPPRVRGIPPKPPRENDYYYKRGIRYLVYPGEVISKVDGDKHVISGAQLIKLYGVDPKECVIYDGRSTTERHNNPYLDLVALHPRYDGKYETAAQVALVATRMIDWQRKNPVEGLP